MKQQHKPEADRAKRLLFHYLDVIAANAGLQLDGENQNEINEITDLIIDAAIRQIREQQKTDSQ